MSIRTRHIWIATIALGCTLCAPSAAQENQTAFSSQNELQSHDVPELKQIFAPREVEVEVLGLKPNGEYERIQSRFVQSMRNKREWFLEYVKSKAEPGKPLPYHQNFGITEEEWNRQLKMIKELRLVPVAKGQLRFSAKSSDQIGVSGIDGLREFDGTIIDIERKQVITPWGTVPLDANVHVRDESILGSWDGFSGRLSTGGDDTESASLIRIDIGRQVSSSRYFMCLSVRIIENGVKTVSIESPVRFP